MYIKRQLEQQIKSASKTYPVVMVCGQRQVGKSTMLYHIKEEDRRYITLDDRNALHLAQSDPALFLETYGTPLFIDEFQRAPEILLEIKKLIDLQKLEGKDTAGMFWLTGSQKFKMMQNVSETLAGRIAVFDMSSLSQTELSGTDRPLFSPEIEQLRTEGKKNKKQDIHSIFSMIFKGGMPALLDKNEDREMYYRNYVNTYIERDIHDLAQVGKTDEFYTFLVYMAANTAQELKYDEISKNVGVSAPTIKNWVSILEKSGIIFILHPYHKKAPDRLIKTPKSYFLDTGLAAYLTKWPSAETLENGNAAGAFLETFVISEIIKSIYNSGKEPDLYYYRDIDQKEIDLLIERADSLYPIEIKKSKSPANPTKNFTVLTKFQKTIKPGIILCMADELVPITRNSYLCPISTLL